MWPGGDGQGETRGRDSASGKAALSASRERHLQHAMLSHSVVSDSATPWTVAHQGPLSMAILQARILEWVAIPSSRGPSQPRDLLGSQNRKKESRMAVAKGQRREKSAKIEQRKV